ncbi:hypothetical protein OG948_53995 (plasmid) [Embleya sp. NBC_00888]|uniref:hypothetical protein n=1 Tax=Embleya sp. NBC_00888 TaxID=2975960 RepID=UPI00386D303D|nr:hypothetical protein OG948_53995 [Embleya sp. NBC_00888]
MGEASVVGGLDQAVGSWVEAACAQYADLLQGDVEPAVFGPVTSDPTVSRLVDTLAAARPAHSRRSGGHDRRPRASRAVGRRGGPGAGD